MMTLHSRASILGPIGLALAVVMMASCDPNSARVTAQRHDATPALFSAADHVPMTATSVSSSGKKGAAPWLEITTVTAAEAEDGRGGRVTAPTAPRGLDVHAESWAGRALDPVLHVGSLHFHRYTFPARGVMRFVVDDVARLRKGDEVSVQWGDDASSRVVLTRSLEVSR